MKNVKINGITGVDDTYVGSKKEKNILRNKFQRIYKQMRSELGVRSVERLENLIFKKELQNGLKYFDLPPEYIRKRSEIIELKKELVWSLDIKKRAKFFAKEEK